MLHQRRHEIRLRLRRYLRPERRLQRLGLYFLHGAVLEFAQFERPEGDADQPVHLQVERLQNLAHLAILAFANADGEPDIGALFAIERRLDRPVMHALDGDAGTQLVERRLQHAAERAHAIAAQPAGRRQFEHARQAAVIGEQQQAFGIDVEAANTNEPW